MAEIPRYIVRGSIYPNSGPESPTGDYVRYADHAAAMAEKQRLKELEDVINEASAHLPHIEDLADRARELVRSRDSFAQMWKCVWAENSELEQEIAALKAEYERTMLSITQEDAAVINRITSRVLAARARNKEGE